MSATIYWEPAARKRNHLSTTAPQDFMEKLEKVTGSRPPCMLGERDLASLRGAAATATDPRPWLELIKAIEGYTDITVEAVY